MRLSADVYRLQRIVEVSKNYLQTRNGRIHFNRVEIPSINELILDFAAELNSRIECRLLDSDQSIQADPFWLKFVLSNFVQNAFAHGAEPVQIWVRRKKEGSRSVSRTKAAANSTT